MLSGSQTMMRALDRKSCFLQAQNHVPADALCQIDRSRVIIPGNLMRHRRRSPIIIRVKQIKLTLEIKIKVQSHLLGTFYRFL